MTARIIDGKIIAAELRARVAGEVARVVREQLVVEVAPHELTEPRVHVARGMLRGALASRVSSISCLTCGSGDGVRRVMMPTATSKLGVSMGRRTSDPACRSALTARSEAIHTASEVSV